MSGGAQASEEPVLAVEAVDVYLGRGHRSTRILDAVSLDVHAGEIVGVIGETGSGKTTLARTIVGLVDPAVGAVRLDARVISGTRATRRRQLRRSGHVQYVFQDPLRSLDPDFTVDRIVAEGLVAQGRLGRDEIARRVSQALRRVGLDDELLTRRPAEISGGQRQRVAIARAIVLEPRLLICDEPVSALDASNRNKILRLLDELRTTLDIAIIVIAHDLSSLAGIADRVLVLYRGQVVEDGSIGEVFSRPAHPYTGLLVASAPNVIHRSLDARQLRVVSRPEQVDAAVDGCVFASRCRFATDSCRRRPPLLEVRPGRRVACHHHDTWRAEHVTHP
ncbi:MAG: oligopeptide/dipeptide transporter, ATPase subunit [Pseudonocardiales bacterium]|nr:oligopeptide/dipeptide transporter, ATPase subunit [Pseudonocardiales bacterium]